MKVINFLILLIGSVLIFTGILEMEFNRKKRCEKIEYRVNLKIFMMIFLLQI